MISKALLRKSHHTLHFLWQKASLSNKHSKP